MRNSLCCPSIYTNENARTSTYGISSSNFTMHRPSHLFIVFPFPLSLSHVWWSVRVVRIARVPVVESVTKTELILVSLHVLCSLIILVGPARTLFLIIGHSGCAVCCAGVIVGWSSPGCAVCCVLAATGCRSVEKTHHQYSPIGLQQQYRTPILTVSNRVFPKVRLKFTS